MEKITVCAPTRIDFAGGTLDIWPLSPIFAPAYTVNGAIDLQTEATVSYREDGQVLFFSHDTGLKQAFAEWESFVAQKKPDFLSCLLIALVERASRGKQEEFRKNGLTLMTKAAVPVGSGLGGSSALAVAVLMGVSRLFSLTWKEAGLVRFLQDLEAKANTAHAGYQDFYPSLFGGVMGICYQLGEIQRVPLPVDLKELSDRIVLVYSGQAHRSPKSNWQALRALLDGANEHSENPVKEGFQKINEASFWCYQALERKDFSGFTEAVLEEWKWRKKIFPQILTPALEKGMETALEAGAKAVRVCGAGGGGCFFSIVDPKDKEFVTQTLDKAGFSPLSFSFTSSGVQT